MNQPTNDEADYLYLGNITLTICIITPRYNIAILFYGNHMTSTSGNLYHLR